MRRRSILGVLAVLIVLAIVAVVLVVRGLQDTTVADSGQETSAGSRAALLDRASIGVAQAFTYKATSLDDDLAKAKKFMTAHMVQKYDDLLTDQAKKDIVARGQTVASKVSADGIVSMTDSTARVLVLLVETTTVTNGQAEQANSSRLMVTWKKVGGTWLIDQMDPL